jgi:DNA-binding PadR family transcriptional regulator
MIYCFNHGYEHHTAEYSDMPARSPTRQQSRHLPAFVLLLLAENPMHGGALQAALNARFPALKADSAAVYRTLQQIEKSGELVSEWDTSGSGPAIRIYRLTNAGWNKLAFWKDDIQERLENLHGFLASYGQLADGNPARLPEKA